MTRRHGRPQRPWHGPCRDGCGAEVAAFVDENGLMQQLETTDTSHVGQRLRTFQHKGPRIGWVRCHYPQQASGRLRTEHRCPELGSTTKQKEIAMTDAFAALDDGSSENSDRFRPATHDGELLLLECSNLLENVATNYGHKDAVQCRRVVVLDGAGAGTIYENVRLFNTVLVSQLTTAAKGARPAVGRMGQGAAGSTGRAPWKLTPATEEEQALAQRYLDGQTTPSPAGGSGSNDVPF